MRLTWLSDTMVGVEMNFGPSAPISMFTSPPGMDCSSTSLRCKNVSGASDVHDKYHKIRLCGGEEHIPNEFHDMRAFACPDLADLHHRLIVTVDA